MSAVSPSQRNQTGEGCGVPSGPTVVSQTIWSSWRWRAARAPESVLASISMALPRTGAVAIVFIVAGAAQRAAPASRHWRSRLGSYPVGRAVENDDDLLTEREGGAKLRMLTQQGEVLITGERNIDG